MKPLIVVFYCLAAVFLQSSFAEIVSLVSPCSLDNGPKRCGQNAVCKRLSSSCDMGICSCQPGRFFPTTKTKTDCVRALRVGQSCSSSRRVNETLSWVLPEFAVCYQGLVRCLPHFTELDGNCIPSPEVSNLPGHPCGGAIICNPYSGLTCAPTAEHNPSSNNNATLYVPNGICLCPNNLIFSEGFCRPALYGDACISDAECNTIFQGAGKCSRKTRRCICNEGFVPIASLVALQPQSSEQVLAHFCLPDSGFHRSLAKFGASCTVPYLYSAEDETPVIYCERDLVCVRCPEMTGPPSRGECQFSDVRVLHEDVYPRLTSGVVLAPSSDYPPSLSAPCNPNSPRPDNECGMNAHCVASDGPCSSGRCFCLNASYVPSNFRPSACDRMLRIGDTCHLAADAHRLPENSACRNNKVGCNSILIPNKDGSECLLPKNGYGTFGDFCDDEYFGCNYLAGLICANATTPEDEFIYGPRFCRCPDYLTYKDERCKPALFGDRCWNDVQCAIVYLANNVTDSPSTCLRNVCMCKTGFLPSGFQNDFYCITSRRLTKDVGETCLATTPVKYLNTTNGLTFCRPGLKCWHCPEFGGGSEQVGRCIEAPMNNHHHNNQETRTGIYNTKTKIKQQTNNNTNNIINNNEDDNDFDQIPYDDDGGEIIKNKKQKQIIHSSSPDQFNYKNTVLFLSILNIIIALINAV